MINDLVATVAQVASVNVTMEIGGATEEVVTVQSKGQELDRSTSTISTLISPQDVQNHFLCSNVLQRTYWRSSPE